MSGPTNSETRIDAPPDLPVITIIREFDASPERVFQAWTDPQLFAQWIGPHSIETRIERWDPRTGGSWRYSAWREGEQVASFYGSFHEVRPSERMVQTFTFEGAPDGVSLETLTLEALPGGRTLAVGRSVVDTIEARDAMLASGMESGIREGFEKLDELFARG